MFYDLLGGLSFSTDHLLFSSEFSLLLFFIRGLSFSTDHCTYCFRQNFLSFFIYLFIYLFLHFFVDKITQDQFDQFRSILAQS